MSWFEKLMPSRISTEKRTRSVPEGVWIKCPKCDAQLYRQELERNLRVCPKCGHHMRIGARHRLEVFLDEDSIEEIATAADRATPNSLKSRPSRPPTKDRGRKTATSTTVVAMTAKPTCLVPLKAATSGASRFSSMRR